MSEIKGQLLGIVLVVAVFGVVGGVLVTAFSKSASNISNKITKDYEYEEVNDSGVYKEKSGVSSIDNSIIKNDSLLTF